MKLQLGDGTVAQMQGQIVVTGQRLISKEGQSPAFLLQVFSVVALLKNDGQVIQTSLAAFLDRLTPEGRRNLQKQA